MVKYARETTTREELLYSAYVLWFVFEEKNHCICFCICLFVFVFNSPAT